MNYDVPKIFLIGFHGVGKKTIMRGLGDGKIKTYPLFKGLEISFFDGKKFPPPEARERIKKISSEEDLKILKDYAGNLIYVLDASKDSASIKEQIDLFNNLEKIYGDEIISVVNKIDISDEKNIKYIEKRVQKPIKISANENIRALKDVLNKKST
jgi:GTP1/Obg family GTP-binding protein